MRLFTPGSPAPQTKSGSASVKPGKARLSRRLQAAFTLVEILLAITVLTVATVGSTYALLQSNYRANLSRLKTGAGSVAQTQIDLFLSLQPYNPQKLQEPPELAVGTHTIGTSSAPTVAIYTDPGTNTVLVWGWVTNDVIDTNQALNGTNFYLRELTCTVRYRYRGQLYTIAMSTMRASDI